MDALTAELGSLQLTPGRARSTHSRSARRPRRIIGAPTLQQQLAHYQRMFNAEHAQRLELEAQLRAEQARRLEIESQLSELQHMHNILRADRELLWQLIESNKVVGFV